MSRLSARTENGNAYLVNVKPDEQEVDSPHKNTLQCILDCFERLAQYEDAEERGLLVVLPCKVGDTVYYIRRNVCKHADATGYCDVDRWYAKKGVKAESGCKDCPHQIPETRIISAPFRLALLDEKKCGHLHVSEIFLTRPEAEAALKGE